MMGTMCLPNSGATSPNSTYFPYNDFQVQSPNLRNMLDNKSPLIVTQRPQTDVCVDNAIKTTKERPKTAKINTQPVKTPAKPAVLKQSSSMFSNYMVSSSDEDFLSQECNTMSGYQTNQMVAGGGFLRDDEEYYLDMDPVEYFYSPIIDIFPISALVSRQQDKSPAYAEKSLKSSSHFLPVIELQSLSKTASTTSTPAPRGYANEHSVKPSNTKESRKSSFVNLHDREKVNNGTKTLHHEKSNKSGKMSAVPEPGSPNHPTVGGKNNYTKSNDTIPHISIIKDKTYVKEVTTTRSKIPIANSYFINGQIRKAKPLNATEKSAITETLTKRLRSEREFSNPKGQGHTKIGVPSPKLTRQDQLLIDVQGNQYPTNIPKLSREKEEPVRNTRIKKRGKALPVVSPSLKIYNEELNNNPSIVDENCSKHENQTLSKPKWAVSEGRHHSKRTDQKTPHLEPIDLHRSDGDRRKLSSQPVPKILLDSSTTLTSSKRPFTDERKLIHEERIGGNIQILPPSKKIHVRVDRRKEASTTFRPTSDRYINEGDTFPFPKKLKPLKVKFSQMHF